MVKMTKKVLLTTLGLAVLGAGAAGLSVGQPRQAAAEQSAPADEAPVPPRPTIPQELTPGEAVKADIEALDAVIQAGLEDLARSTADFAGERKKWQALDRSMASARTVNAALFARNKAVVGLYEAKLDGPLARFRSRLSEAPGVYRKMADERRVLLNGSTLDIERRNYLAMIETCEAAAILCEKRREELFGETAPEEGFGNRVRRPNAVSLRRTIDNMKKLQPMHEKWEETFNAYPSALEAPGLSNWFDALSLYGEDLDAFTKSVEGLKDAMKKKAALPAPAKAAE